jgi:hypothetical protein
VPHTKRINRLGIVSLLVLTSTGGKAQEQNTPPDLHEQLSSMQREIRELQAAVTSLRAESAAYKGQTDQLRRELAAAQKIEPVRTESAASLLVEGEAVQRTNQQVPIEEELQMLDGKINDQYQTKVESASKYRVRLSGMILMNLFGNRGSVDSIDVPGIAEPQGPLFGKGALGGTLRQSQVGLEVFGPTWAGARVSGSLHFDLAGGFPDTSNGVSLGIIRLRTGGVRLDWEKTSVVAGQEAPFFSPLSPSSLATVAEPAFSYSGNLWDWVPQIHVDRELGRLGPTSFFIQAGILDSLTGDPPQAQTERLPQAGEIARQPAYAVHIASQWGSGEEPTTVGFGGYYSRQDWAFGRMVDGWAGTADWQISLPLKLSLSGELYRGRGIGGLGAATYHSVLSTGVLNSSQSLVQGLDVVGGWGQLKYRATSTLQFNAAYGQDNPFGKQLREFSAFQNLLDPELGRNQSFLLNFIYKPKSNLLFSTEYRHINSGRLTQDRFTAEHMNISIGVLF